MRSRLLLTGFEPFSRFNVNPSWEAARSTAEALGPTVVAVRLPVDYLRARDRLLEVLAEYRPLACLCMGLAAGDEFRQETCARKPSQFSATPGEALLRGEWEFAATAEALTGLGVPHRMSDDAGRYVCESTYWALLDFRRRERWPARAGFLHVPAVSERFDVGRITTCVECVARAFLGLDPVSSR